MKVYELEIDEQSCTFDTVENLALELRGYNESLELVGETGPNESAVLDGAKSLVAGQQWSDAEATVKCYEMSEEEFNAMPEFNGW